MAFPDEPQGVGTPSGETVHEPFPDENVSYSDNWSSSGSSTTETAPATSVISAPPPPSSTPTSAKGGGGKPPKPPDPPDESDDDEEGMARMSFLEHLEELRKRLLLAVGGIGVGFFLCLFFSDELWSIVVSPARNALTHLGVKPPELAQISPMDAFRIMWMDLPILAAVFVSSPWILYQVWAFIAPGLYKRERRWAVPFVVSSAGLFILGGIFAYFVAFRYGLEFLMGLAMGKGVHPTISMSEYYDLFVDVMLGVGIVFEIPILLFLLTLVRVVNPSFLVRHSRYAILIIVILAAVITPTGDVFNLALFATPMIILFYLGIFASWILVLHREKRRFPWRIFYKWLGIILVLGVLTTWVVFRYYGYHFVPHWPIFVR
ncbi:MAG TPA: twin-arginine translocase subunit TatC [Bryobacteraceae bacterium]|jgi:sec-independent protein translocase protein TatC|nr:twin-arginine translocase subunit TatC [Bryobacteraceae bacterium]